MIVRGYNASGPEFVTAPSIPMHTINSAIVNSKIAQFPVMAVPRTQAYPSAIDSGLPQSMKIPPSASARPDERTAFVQAQASS